MTKLTWLTLPVVLGAVLLSGCGEAAGLEVGSPAPEFTLTDTAGNPVSLDEYRDGGPALLYFHMAVG